MLKYEAARDAADRPVPPSHEGRGLIRFKQDCADSLETPWASDRGRPICSESPGGACRADKPSRLLSPLMRSVVGDSSILLWAASALIAFLGARAFTEYLRRLHHDGPVRLWRELLTGSFALTVSLWAAMIIEVASKGLVFEMGYHPVKCLGMGLLSFLVTVAIVAGATFRPSWYAHLAAAALLTLVGLILQVSVIWSIGAEPGLAWQAQPLVFALLLLLAGLVVCGQMVVGTKRGSKGDRGSRRLMGALVMGACAVAAQELVLEGSGLDRQVVSANARFLPEVVYLLLAGAAVPIVLILMIVDQRSQKRARASERARRRRQFGDGNESRFSESLLAEVVDSQPPHTR